MIPEYCYSPLGLARYYFFYNSQNTICQEALEYLSSAPDSVSLKSYLMTFGMTCLLESPFYFFANFRKVKWIKKGMSSVLLCNLSTHPAIYFLFPLIGGKLFLQYSHVLLAAEIFAPVAEALLLTWIWKIHWRWSLFWMVSANLFSWWVGIYLV